MYEITRKYLFQHDSSNGKEEGNGPNLRRVQNFDVNAGIEKVANAAVAIELK